MQLNLFMSLDNKGFFKLFVWMSLMVLVSLLFHHNFNFKKIEFFSVSLSLSNLFYKKSSVEVQHKFKGYSKLMVKSFLFILCFNLFGLMPYVFGPSSQMVFVMMLSFILWLSIFISSIMFLPVEFISHLSPKSCPLWLVGLLKLMELMSNLIRPLTLTLRLSMNITTGHILLSLMSSGLLALWFKNNLFFSLVMLSVVMLYILFELFVSLIQSFVFGLLLNQYLNDHSS